jgi:post-segregation antitoxin (ccd killing protein)
MQKTKIHKVRITEQQAYAFEQLKKYDVNLSQFIRQAIKEKLQRDWKQIKESKNKSKCPF